VLYPTNVESDNQSGLTIPQPLSAVQHIQQDFSAGKTR
jgi:hypothetical protein